MKTKCAGNGAFWFWCLLVQFLASSYNYCLSWRLRTHPARFYFFISLSFSLQVQENIDGGLGIDPCDSRTAIYVLFSGFCHPPTDTNSLFFCGDSACTDNAAGWLRGPCQTCKSCVRDALAARQLESRGSFLFRSPPWLASERRSFPQCLWPSGFIRIVSQHLWLHDQESNNIPPPNNNNNAHSSLL